jgi:hypothetical protein
MVFTARFADAGGHAASERDVEASTPAQQASATSARP